MPHPDHLDEFTKKMLCEHGPLLTGDALWRSLGFISSAAFRQAKARDQVGVKLFTVPHRRGTYAYTHVVADWLCSVGKGGEI